jgi:hypothetical protein
VLLAGGCDNGKRRTQPPPPAKHESFIALDREHQRLVADYEPVSRAMTAYELAYRDWRLGRLAAPAIASRAAAYRTVVVEARRRVARDRATGETVRAKRLLVTALRARAGALQRAPGSSAYRADWDRSLEAARAGLTVLQDIRDRARLIPLPEDSVS